MGQEIQKGRFSKRDFERFRAHLEAETALLQACFEQGRLSEAHAVGGFELEAWLVDRRGRPAPVNEPFLERLNSPLASPELARFNIEVNSTPQVLAGTALADMHAELVQTWAHCRETAAALDSEVVMIGILPTVSQADLTLANMSGLTRYRALNEQVLRLRQGRPLVLDIAGEQHLHTEHGDVMLESAATSFQIHLQVDRQRAARYYNAAVILSAPMVALSANSPYLFGRDLWDETRIPLFEQAVAVGGYEGAVFGPIRRVTFGSGYVRASLLEAFQENLEHYPVLLPVELQGPPEHFEHLRLHNGTIWRWNRPLVGFDADARPHLRIEHRVVPAGPTPVDAMANAAFFYGMVTVLAEAQEPPEARLDFVQARDNFYTAARRGLRAPASWLDARHGSIQTLIVEHLLPQARQGLSRLGISRSDIQEYLGIVEARVRSGHNGAWWQRAYVAEHGPDMAALTAAYLERQIGGQPVHTWPV